MRLLFNTVIKLYKNYQAFTHDSERHQKKRVKMLTLLH